MIPITDDGFGPFILIEGKKIKLNEEQVRKINLGCSFENGEIIETEYYKNNIKQDLITQINFETREKILSRYSETDQTNLSQDAQVIMGIAQYEKRDFTEDEINKLLEAKTMRDFRAECIEEGKTKIRELGN